MTNTIIGNAISLVANVCLIISSIKKDKKQILFYQTLFCVLIGIASFVFGAYSVVLLNILGVVRNLCVMYEKNTKIVNIVLFVSSVVLAIVFNSNGYYGILPVVSACIENYLILKPNVSVKVIKFAFAISSICWVIFNLTINNYVSAIFNLGSAILNVIYLIKKEINAV